MPDAFEEQAVLVAAEQAAAEGDATAAEGHLRTLLELQSARLGPDHPEVASTLHNLAVVCERAGRISDAEGLYRRAFAAASAALPPTDSLVVRCHEDLNAFLEARLMPVQPAVPAPAASAQRPGPRRRPRARGRRGRRSAAARTPRRARASRAAATGGANVARTVDRRDGRSRRVLVAVAAWWATRDAPAPPAAAPNGRPVARQSGRAAPANEGRPPPRPLPRPRRSRRPRRRRRPAHQPTQPSPAAVQPAARATPPAAPAARRRRQRRPSRHRRRRPTPG